MLATVTQSTSVLTIGAFQFELLEFVLLTVLIEVPLFYLCGYRRIVDCLYFAGVNVVTNLLLNEFLLTTDAASYWQVIFICEVVVVILEFVLCSYRFSEEYYKLVTTLIFTNAVSFFAGVILM